MFERSTNISSKKQMAIAGLEFISSFFLKREKPIDFDTNNIENYRLSYSSDTISIIW
jgi:hypothetical protein